MGTLYAGACLLLGEIPADAVLSQAFDPKKYTFCYKEFKVKYTKKAPGDITTEVKITNEDVERMKKEVGEDGKSY